MPGQISIDNVARSIKSVRSRASRLFEVCPNLSPNIRIHLIFSIISLGHYEGFEFRKKLIIINKALSKFEGLSGENKVWFKKRAEFTTA